MIWKAGVILCLTLCVICDKRPATSEQKIELFTGHNGHLSHIGQHKPKQLDIYAWAYPAYEFSYYVNDPHTHDMKGQYEMRDGDKVTGNYWLIQPDGRKRTVKYTSDHKNGLHAEVSYQPHEGHHYESKQRHGKKHEHEDHHHWDQARGRIGENKGDRLDLDHDNRGRIGIEERRYADKDKQNHDNSDNQRAYGEKRDHDDKRDHDKNQVRDDKRNHDVRRGREDRQDHDDKRGGNNEQGRYGIRDRDGKQRDDDKRDRDGKRDHNDRRGHDGKKEHDDNIRDNKDNSWGWIKQRKEFINHPESSKDGLGGRRFGHGHEEHWKHGVLVGWREGTDYNNREQQDSFKDHMGDDNRSARHEHRQSQHSFHAPNFIPFGQRLN